MNINIFCKVISESFANKPQTMLINSTLFNHLPQVLKGASFASKSNFLWETPSFDYIPEDQDWAAFSMITFCTQSAAVDFFCIANLPSSSPESSLRPSREATACHEIPDLQAKGGNTDSSGGHLRIRRLE